MTDNKFKWSSKYTVGVKILDYDHQELFATINELRQAMEESNETNVIGSLISRLQKYAMEHFQREEHILSEYGFSSLAAHRRKHLGFMRLVYAIRHIHKNCPEKLSYKKLLRFLERWLTHHIMVEDMQYSDTIRGGAYGNRTTDIIKPLSPAATPPSKKNAREKRKQSDWTAVTVHVPAHTVDIIERCARTLQIDEAKTELLDDLTNPIGAVNNAEALDMAKIVLK